MLLSYLLRWIDNETVKTPETPQPHVFSWSGTTPFVVMHLGCLGVIWTGWSLTAVAVAIALYCVRMFAITAFYHRYFSHRTFRTTRFWQFIFGVMGASAVQRGPLWWAAQHRHHHAHSDDPEDVHSPHQHGLAWAHMGWLTSRAVFPTDMRKVRDLARFPELRFLNRYELVVPLALAFGLFGLGGLLGYVAPGLGVGAWQMLVWGFFISTVVLFHATCTINSLAHLMGKRRYETTDHSRNSLFLALLTFGEGWHNNHHYYPSSARQGFYWWELDLSYYLLKMMSWVGIVWDLRPVPLHVRDGIAKAA